MKRHSVNAPQAVAADLESRLCAACRSGRKYPKQAFCLACHDTLPDHLKRGPTWSESDYLTALQWLLYEKEGRNRR